MCRPGAQAGTNRHGGKTMAMAHKFLQTSANRTYQVWSFSPPDEQLYDRPLSLREREIQDNPSRPMSAMALDFRSGASVMAGPSRHTQDVDMQDACSAAGPSTAPLQGGNKTFFHDD